MGCPEERPSTEEARSSLAAIAGSGIPVRRRDLVLFTLSTNWLMVALIGAAALAAAASWSYWVVGLIGVGVAGLYTLLNNLIRAVPKDVRALSVVGSLPCLIPLSVAFRAQAIDWPLRLLIAGVPLAALDVLIVRIGSRRT